MRNTWVELDLDVLAGNIRSLRRALPAKTDILFVVKANAYGHGVEPVARHAWAQGIRAFCVAHLEEGAALRAMLPDARILMLGALRPTETGAALHNGITPLFINERHARAIAAEATRLDAVIHGHAKIDTGMGRLGFAWDEAAGQLPELARMSGIEITGMCTHFASAGRGDRTFADVQIERFRTTLEACRRSGFPAGFVHVANSGAIALEPDWDYDGVRTGILLYGYGHAPERRGIQTQPILSWKTRLLQIKSVPAGFPIGYDSTYVTPAPTLIGTIDVGYADGYPRAMGNRGAMLIGGRRCPVVGRVCMNFATVDLGPDADVREGATVVLIGTQGDEFIGADDLAAWAGTISYDILTGIRATDRQITPDSAG